MIIAPDNTPDNAASDAGPRVETITLEVPIRRAQQMINTLRLRKPTAGELRGLKLQDLMQSDVNAVIALIPRISEPKILADEAERLDLADLTAIAGVVMGFFMSKTEQAAMARFLGIAEQQTN